MLGSHLIGIDPTEILKGRIAAGQSKASLASELGISRTALYYLLEGRFRPGRKVLGALGLEERVTYRKLAPQATRDR